MGLAERLNEDMKAAMKAKDQARLDVIRMARAAIKQREIDARTDGTSTALTEDEAAQVLRKLVKQRQEAAELYDKGERPELAAKERAEIGVLEEYLPKQAGAEEIEAAVRAVAAELGATSMKQMGQVMKAALARLGGAADGKAVSETVRRVLGG
ncbi:MAG: GatB/YqeY domain-containing protein [Candidatus Methylomirabilis sp.]|nr:GatB/YqeY domain-containing protein [Deltaproteobacteria bacterium]